MTGSPIQGNGFQTVYLSPNGISTPDLVGQYLPPQTNIWNQYARMFDFYQVQSVSMKVYPYKYETTSSLTGVAQVDARPFYSCVDPESTGPDTSDGIASYGNMKVSQPYHVHERALPFHQLGIQKQDRLILRTGGDTTGRERYSKPA